MLQLNLMELKKKNVSAFTMSSISQRIVFEPCPVTTDSIKYISTYGFIIFRFMSFMVCLTLTFKDVLAYIDLIVALTLKIRQESAFSRSRLNHTKAES